MKQVVLFSICLIGLALSGGANNVKLVKQAYVNPSSVVGTGASAVATVEFGISWENSWRDDYNWDAVYIFMKCKRKSEKVWQHVTLKEVGHTVTSGYDWWLNKNVTTVDKAQGIFVYPSTKTSGTSVVNMQVKWSLVAPTNYTKQEFVEDQIEYVVSCVEMVYIPKGPFCLGDGIGNRAFKSFMPIEPEWDVINIEDPRLRIWSDEDTTDGRYWDYPPMNVANRINEASASVENAWSPKENVYLYIDLGEPKTISYFGISSGSSSNYRPTNYSLMGSIDCKTWKPLRSGSKDDLTVDNVTYPVPNALKISESNRASYRYYRLYCYGSPSYYVINNIAMTEVDIESVTANYYVVNSLAPQLNATVDLGASDGETWSGALQVNYPTGYEGFFAMKYEISQEQYVRFLNKLTGTQQLLRTIGSRLNGLNAGDYVYGSTPATPSFRSGIVVAARLDESVVFANDLDKTNPISQESDGQALACNYLSVDDMLAYADWAGLRPLSEMEYEKMCRPLYPDIPKRGEWPWNSNQEADIKMPASETITDPGMNSEKVPDANINAGNKILGPVRVGSFAKGATNQQEAGASYWGVMELGGNLAELYYNLTPTGRAFDGNQREGHGNGILKADGDTDIGANYWPQTVGTAFAVRGGSYATTNVNYMRVSDRTSYSNRFSDLNRKDPDVTFRLGYTHTNLSPVVKVCTTYLTLENGKMSSANGIADVICDDKPYTIKGTPLYSSGTSLMPLDGKVSYMWYMNTGNVTTDWEIMPGETGQNLTYHFHNRKKANQVIYVKRITTTPTLESETFYVTLTVVNTFNRINRLRDTIKDNNQALGFLFETGSNASYVWKWTGESGNIQVKTGATLFDYYFPQRSDFANRSGQSFTVRCEATILTQCVVTRDVEVYVEPRPTVGIPSESITIKGADPANECGVMMQDLRDNNVYGTVEINGKCWMAENLRRVQAGGLTTVYQTGDPDGSLYGVLYQWTAALHNSACPEGWKLPSKTEYDELITFLKKDGKDEAGIKVKAGNFWKVTDAIGNRNAMGRNTSGFGAIAAGAANGSALGTTAYFICSADAGTSGLFYTATVGAKTFTYAGAPSTNYFSVRCIKK